MRLLVQQYIAQEKREWDKQFPDSFYDGLNWRNLWNSTNEQTVLPKAVKLQLTLAEERGPAGTGNRSVRAPLEIVVPLLLTASTNQAASDTAASTGAPP